MKPRPGLITSYHRSALLLTFLLSTLPPIRLGAQQTGAVAGIVADLATSQPLAAAQVLVTGTSISVVTDVLGLYRLEGVPAGTVEVRVQRLGYTAVSQSVQVQAGAAVTLDFALAVSPVALDELLVTVTGQQRRREIGNATVLIRAEEELEVAAPPSLTQLLQGRAPGVQILQSSGTVGAASSIKIRGNSTISLDNTPLIYIDGSRVSNDNQSGPSIGGQNTSRLDDINLDDIESIEIVKGPSAATLYGTEAAAGVIRITTKQGRVGANEWTLRSEVGANWDATDWPETVWNPRGFYGDLLDVSELFAPGTLPPNSFAAIPDTLYALNLLKDGRGGDESYGTPWRTGVEQSYGVSLNGGAGNISYFVSGDLSHRLGSLSNNHVSQRSLRANLNLTPSERTQFTVSTGFSSNDASLPDNDNSTFGYIGVAMIAFPWVMPVTRRDLVTGQDRTTCPAAFEIHRALKRAGFDYTLDDLGDECAKNPFFGERTFDQVATLSNAQKVERFNGSVTLNHRPLDFLTLRGTLGYDEFSDQTGAFVPVDPELPFLDASFGFRSINHLVVRNLTADASASAVFDLSSTIRSTTSVGGQFFREKFESTGSVGRTLPPGVETVSNAVRTEGFEGKGEGRSAGFYVQEQIAWRDRLFLVPAVRFDESSTFGQSNPKQGYPRFMASYVISEEGWFDGFMPGGFLESLRLRGAWGQSGKEPASFAALQVLGSRRVTFRETDVSGVALVGPGNPDLKPERGQELELGFDASMFSGRVGVEFTYFSQTTRDALVARPVAPSTGFSSFKAENIGELKNQGTELGVTAVAWNAPDFRWDWRLNIGTTKGEVTELDEPIVYGIEGNSQRHQEGYPYASYFSRTYSLRNGEAVASDSAVFIGHPTPEYEGSISSNVQISGWLTLHATLGFAGGHQQFNSTQEFRCGFLGGGTYGSVCPETFEVLEDGERTGRAKIKAQAAQDLQYSPWMENADFARLRTVSVRFDLPGSWVGRVGASNASFTLMGENLALFTKYSGLDPEINFAGGSQSSRAEFLTLPPGRRVMGRLSITF